MTQEQKRIKLAEAGGWTTIHKGLWVESMQTYAALPDYFTDLNAVHELEKRMPSKHWTRYCQYLADFGRGSVRFVSVHATAAQRAEAIGLTLGLWEAAK